MTTEAARGLTGLGVTGSLCLALLANVLPTTPGDLDRWCEVELEIETFRNPYLCYFKINFFILCHVKLTLIWSGPSYMSMFVRLFGRKM